MASHQDQSFDNLLDNLSSLSGDVTSRCHANQQRYELLQSRLRIHLQVQTSYQAAIRDSSEILFFEPDAAIIALFRFINQHVPRYASQHPKQRLLLCDYVLQVATANARPFILAQPTGPLPVTLDRCQVLPALAHRLCLLTDALLAFSKTEDDIFYLIEASRKADAQLAAELINHHLASRCSGPRIDRQSKPFLH